MQADEDKCEAVSIVELEERYQRYDAMIENVRHASLHPLHNIVGHEGSSHDYKQPVVSNFDGTKHKNSSPPFPRSLIIQYHLPGIWRVVHFRNLHLSRKRTLRPPPVFEHHFHP